MQGGFQELLDEFLLEAQERADEVESMLLKLASANAEDRDAAIARAKRELHTLKGNSGMMGFSDLQQIAHLMEDQVEELDLEDPRIDPILVCLDELRQGLDAIKTPDGPAPDDEIEASVETSTTRDAASVRVPFARIDRLVETQAETLIFRNRLASAVELGEATLQLEGLPPSLEEPLRAAWESVNGAMQSLGKTLDQMQEQITELGMVPLQSLFRSLGRIVHDESRREGKSVDFTVHGGDTPIDKTLIEAAGDALGHLVRNAVIHGIESPDRRRRAGKPETGKVGVAAVLEAGEVRIEVIDDGAGVDIAALRAKADARGPEFADTDDAELLFADGLSTRQGTDLGAGRGVGLSAVRKSVEAHGGRVRVESEPGQGSRFNLHLPVTASIVRSLLLSVGGEDYALPITAIAESLTLEGQSLHEMNHARVMRWRNSLVPLIDLGTTFGSSDSLTLRPFVTVIEINGRLRGLLIDRLSGIRDIVVKGLDSIVGQPRGISGSTILGDGRVIMILDPASLVSMPPTTDFRASGAGSAGPGTSDSTA
ncbi:MAG: chemotaxis protein CheW [Acidobacteriota bacterium]